MPEPGIILIQLISLDMPGHRVLEFRIPRTEFQSIQELDIGIIQRGHYALHIVTDVPPVPIPFTARDIATAVVNEISDRISVRDWDE